MAFNHHRHRPAMCSDAYTTVQNHQQLKFMYCKSQEAVLRYEYANCVSCQHSGTVRVVFYGPFIITFKKAPRALPQRKPDAYTKLGLVAYNICNINTALALKQQILSFSVSRSWKNEILILQIILPAARRDAGVCGCNRPSTLLAQ